MHTLEFLPSLAWKTVRLPVWVCRHLAVEVCRTSGFEVSRLAEHLLIYEASKPGFVCLSVVSIPLDPQA